MKKNQSEEKANTINVKVKPKVKTYICVIGFSIIGTLLYRCGCDDAAAAIEHSLNKEIEEDQ